MNAWPTLSEWSRFALVLALEIFIVFALAKLSARRFKSAQWRRALWQSALVAMALITLGELNGVRSLLRFPSPAKAASKPQRAVMVTLKDPDPSLLQPALELPPLASAVPREPAALGKRRASWPIWVWACGLALVLSRPLLAVIFTIAFRVSGRRVTQAEIVERTRHLAQLLGIRRMVLLAESPRAVTPFTLGIFKPAIILPMNFSETFTPEQRDVALAHELAHIANLDSAWRAFSHLACALLWWHPAVWLARRELNHASELVADEASLLITDGPHRLAECLMLCAKQLRRPALVTWLGMDGGGFRSALGQRVARLLQLPSDARLTRALPWYVRMLAPAAVASLLWLTVAVIESSHSAQNGWRGSIIGTAMARPAEDSPASVAQGKSAQLQTNDGTGPLAAARSSNPPHSDAEQKAVGDKLKQIRLSEFGPIDNVPLSDVIRMLGDEARRRDPEKKGVNFFLTSKGKRVPGSEDMIDIDSISIRVGMTMRDITLEQALRIMIDASQRPIQISIEDYGVLVSPRIVSPTTPLLNRTFKIDAASLLQNLDAIETPGRRTVRKNPEQDLLGVIKRYFSKTGIDLEHSGRSIYFNARVGTIYVRATSEEMETIERLLEFVTRVPLQLVLNVKALEISLSSSNAAWEWFMGGILRTNAANAKDVTEQPTVTGILTPAQFRATIRNLEKRGGTDLLSAPEITTQNGRQAQIKVVDIRYVVTDLEINSATNAHGRRGNGNTEAKTNVNGVITQPIAEPFEIGPIVDIIPTVQPDEYTIFLSVQPSMREFLGYDDPGTFFAKIEDKEGKVEQQPVPLPKFRLRKASVSASVWDGQTLVIGAGTARDPVRERQADGTFKTRYIDKALFFFVTPRLIDQAGNPLHPNEELFGKAAQ